MIKTRASILLFTWDVMRKSMFKRLVYTPPDSSPRTKLVEHKKSGLIFYFGLSFRQRNATCKLAATKDYRGACVS